MLRVGIAFLLVMVLASCGAKKEGVSPVKKTRFVIYNKGRDGHTSGNLVNRVDNDVLALKPGLVIIMIGTNDVGYKVPFNTYRSNITTIIDKIHRAGADIIIMSPPPRGTDVISYPEYRMNDKTDSIAKIDSIVSKQLGCYFINMNRLFKEAGTPNPTASSMLNNAANNPGRPDGVHPNANGMVFIASHIYDFMKANLVGKMNQPKLDIVCFGDSITWGTGSPLSYPTQLETLLNQ